MTDDSKKPTLQLVKDEKKSSKSLAHEIVEGEGVAVEKGRGPSQASQLVALAREKYEMFMSEDGRPYGVKKEGANIALPLRGKAGLRSQLALLYTDSNGGAAPSQSALADAMTVLEGAAQAADPRVPHLRIGRHNDRIVVDLGTADGRCVTIGPDGWDRSAKSPVLFRRSGAMKPLPEPVRDGDGLARLQTLLNTDEEHFRLLEQAGIGSAVVLPLIARGQVLGAMTLVRAPTREPYSDAELPLLEELARRAALSVDNARLLEEANEAVRLRDDFLAMASHDMRTPLSVILANIQLARRKLAAGEHADASRHMESAERTTQKMTGLVGELMDVTILRAGHQLPLRHEHADLAAIARAHAEDYQRMSDQHRVVVSAPDTLVGEWDASRVERVLRNLLDNALKYSPHGGDIRLDVTEETDASGRRWAAIAVEDEGVGIPEDELPQLFEKYHRGSNTRELRGTGLGLAGSRAVIEQLGGSIEVSSRLGVGSVFTVRLPANAAS